MLPKYFVHQKAYGGSFNLAEPYFDDDSYAAQVKLDGSRYYIHYDIDGSVRIYSRQISKKTGLPVDKTDRLPHIVKYAKEQLYPGTVLDGELCAPGKSRFNLVTTVTGSLPERALQLQEEHGFLVFHAFDIVAHKGSVIEQKELRSRHFLLEELFYSDFENTKFNRPIDYLRMVYGKRKFELWADQMESGGEGVILKNLSSPYRQGKRHKDWIKAKRQATYEVIFLGIEMAEEMTVKKGDTEATRSRIAGLPGSIRFGQLKPKSDWYMELSHELVELGTVSGFDDELRLDLAKNWEQYAKEQRVFEITAQERFPNGKFQSPRWGRWRPDKHAHECILRLDEG